MTAIASNIIARFALERAANGKYSCRPSPKSSDKSEKILNQSSVEESKQGYGVNPVSVLIAACGAARALSRSVSVLRTTLIDSGVAEPVFRLLQHSEIEVQIAATATVCNLLTDVSPMREVSVLPSIHCNKPLTRLSLSPKQAF